LPLPALKKSPAAPVVCLKPADPWTRRKTKLRGNPALQKLSEAKQPKDGRSMPADQLQAKLSANEKAAIES
jgi:hypothetical protein